MVAGNLPPDGPAPADGYPFVYDMLVAGGSATASWSLGESSGSVASDKIGTAHGTYVGSPTLGVAGAFPGNPAAKGVLLNGTSQYITTPASIPGDTFSLAVWFKRTAVGDMTIWRTAQATAVGINARFRVGTDDLNIDNGTTTFFRSVEAISDTTNWHLLLITKAGATRAAYVDTVALTNAQPNAVVSADTGLTLGARPTGAGPTFNGAFQSATLFGYALTPAQGNALYAARFSA